MVHFGVVEGVYVLDGLFIGIDEPLLLDDEGLHAVFYLIIINQTINKT